MSTISIEQQAQEMRNAGYTLQEIGETLNLSKSRIGQITSAPELDKPKPISSLELEGTTGNPVLLSNVSSPTLLEHQKLTLDTQQPQLFLSEQHRNPIMTLVNICKEEIQEFLFDMDEIYLRHVQWLRYSFVRFPEKASRLVRTIEALCNLLDKPAYNLLIIHVLSDIRNTLLDSLDQNEVDENPNCDHIATGIHLEKVTYWNTALEADLFQLINE